MTSRVGLANVFVAAATAAAHSIVISLFLRDSFER